MADALTATIILYPKAGDSVIVVEGDDAGNVVLYTAASWPTLVRPDHPIEVR